MPERQSAEYGAQGVLWIEAAPVRSWGSWGHGAAAVRGPSKGKEWCSVCARTTRDGWHYYPLVGWVCTPCAARHNDGSGVEQ